MPRSFILANAIINDNPGPNDELGRSITLRISSPNATLSLNDIITNPFTYQITMHNVNNDKNLMSKYFLYSGYNKFIRLNNEKSNNFPLLNSQFSFKITNFGIKFVTQNRNVTQDQDSIPLMYITPINITWFALDVSRAFLSFNIDNINIEIPFPEQDIDFKFKNSTTYHIDADSPQNTLDDLIYIYTLTSTVHSSQTIGRLRSFAVTIDMYMYIGDRANIRTPNIDGMPTPLNSWITFIFNVNLKVYNGPIELNQKIYDIDFSLPLNVANHYVEQQSIIIPFDFDKTGIIISSPSIIEEYHSSLRRAFESIGMTPF